MADGAAHTRGLQGIFGSSVPNPFTPVANIAAPEVQHVDNIAAPEVQHVDNIAAPAVQHAADTAAPVENLVNNNVVTPADAGSKALATETTPIVAAVTNPGNTISAAISNSGLNTGNSATFGASTGAAGVAAINNARGQTSSSISTAGKAAIASAAGDGAGTIAALHKVEDSSPNAVVAAATENVNIGNAGADKALGAAESVAKSYGQLTGAQQSLGPAVLDVFQVRTCYVVVVSA